MMSYFLFKLPFLAKHLSKYYLEKKNGEYFTSNVNEVIRSVLNSLFFYEKISHAPKAQKYKDATKQKHKTLQANKNKKCA